MVFEPKCILITGATSEGIGKALALALLDLPSKPKIVITGRRQEKLDEICRSSERLYGRRLDQTAPRADLQKWTGSLLSEFPDLDMVVLNAGIQHNVDFLEADKMDFDLVNSPHSNAVRMTLSLPTHAAAGDRDLHQLYILAHTGGRIPSSPSQGGRSRSAGASYCDSHVGTGGDPESRYRKVRHYTRLARLD